jgi:hypothetical protein
VRIDPKIPQGDRNLYLPTIYIKYDPAPSISNLKDPIDIIRALLKMQEMESDPEIIRFAEHIIVN